MNAARAGDLRGPRRRTREDGGVARLVLAGVTANLAVGTLFAWSLVADDAADGVGMSSDAAAGVFAGAIVVFAGVLLAGGALQRRVSPRRLLLAAAVLGGGGLLLAATAGGPVVLAVGVAVLFGTANGLAYGVAASLAARVPLPRRGSATGVVVAAYAAGPAVLGLVAPAALRDTGWRAGLGVLAAVVAALLAVASRLAPGQRPLPAGREDGGAPVPARPVVLLWVVFAGASAPGLAIFADAVPLAADRHLGPQAAGLAVSALALGNLAGRVASGWWSDRIGRLAALTTALGTAAAGIGSLAGSTASLALVGFLATGLAYGAASSLVPAATADRVGPHAFPAAYGRVFTGWGVAGLLAPVAGERLLGAQPVLVALLAAPLVPAAGALLLLARRGPRPARSGPTAAQ